MPWRRSLRQVGHLLGPFMFILLFYSIGASADDPILSRFVEGLTANPFLIGLLVSISWIVFTIASEPAGSIIDLIGARKAILLGGGLEAATLVIIWLTKSPYVFAIAMALAGIGSAFFWSASRTHIANFCRGKTGAAFGTYVASWGLGWAIGPLIGGALAFFWNIRAPYLFGAIVLAITVIVFMQILPPDKHIKASKSTIAKKLRGGFLKDGIAFLKIAPNGVKQIFLIQMLMYSALQIVLIFAPLYFIKLNNAEIGVLFFVQSIVFAAGGALWGLLAEGSKKFLFVVTGFLASSGVIFLLLKSTDFISAIIFMGIFGLTLALIEPISDAILNDCVDRKARGVANGFSQAAYGLGGGIGPLVGGAVAAIYGISSTFILAIALCLGGVVVGLSLRR